MKKVLLEESKIIETIEKIQKDFFTIFDFMETFIKLCPEEWENLIRRYGLFGKKRRYTVATYLANRLYTYPHKSNSLLKPFQKYKKEGKEITEKQPKKKEKSSEAHG